MIGDDQVFVRRLYGYKDKTVNILAVVKAERTGQKAVVYTDALNPESYPLVIPLTEFCNHANMISNVDEIITIRDEVIQSRVNVTDLPPVDTVEEV